MIREIINFCSRGLFSRLKREKRVLIEENAELKNKLSHAFAHISNCGISPMMLGIDVQYFTHKDCKDMHCEKFDIKNNPVHAQVYNLMQDLIKHKS